MTKFEAHIINVNYFQPKKNFYKFPCLNVSEVSLKKCVFKGVLKVVASEAVLTHCEGGGGGEGVNLMLNSILGAEHLTVKDIAEITLLQVLFNIRHRTTGR